MDIFKLGDKILALLEMVFGFWNNQISLVYAMLGQSPVSFKGGGPWAVIEGIEPVFVAVGSSLVVLFFVIGFCSESIDVKDEMRFESIFRMLIRLGLAEWFVANNVTIMKAFFTSIGNLVGLISAGTTTQLAIDSTQADIIDRVVSLFEEHLTMVKGRFLGSRSKYSGIDQHLQDGVCIIGFLCMPLAVIKELVEFKFVVDIAQCCVAKVFSKVVSDAKPVRIIKSEINGSLSGFLFFRQFLCSFCEIVYWIIVLFFKFVKITQRFNNFMFCFFGCLIIIAINNGKIDTTRFIWSFL